MEAVFVEDCDVCFNLEKLQESLSLVGYSIGLKDLDDELLMSLKLCKNHWLLETFEISKTLQAILFKSFFELDSLQRSWQKFDKLLKIFRLDFDVSSTLLLYQSHEGSGAIWAVQVIELLEKREDDNRACLVQ